VVDSRPEENGDTRDPRAILFADLAGYTRRVAQDERGTVAFMADIFETLRHSAPRFGGTLVKTTGDGVVLTFADPGTAVAFGLELHRIAAHRQAGQPEPALFRVGIHLGMISASGNDIYGHAVNVAARLESEAEPGGIVVSLPVQAALRSDGRWLFESLGAPPLKNVAERIPLFRVREAAPSATPVGGEPLRLQLLGPVAIFRGGIPRTPARRAVRCLLAALALARGQSETGDRLAAMLWPERPLARARAALARTRRQAAGALGADHAGLLVVEAGRLTLDELGIETDLQAMEAQLRAWRVPPALAAEDWPERLLEGLDGQSAVFDAWLKVTRESWRARLGRGLALMLGQLGPEEPGTRDAAAALLALEPGNEAAALALVRHHLATGSRTAALAVYRRVEAHLRTAHGLVPGDALARAIASATAPAPAAQPRRFLRLAVAAFEGATTPEAAGFRADLVANLARFREWSVVEREGTGAEPGDDYLLRGILRPGAEGDRIALALTATADGSRVWGEAVSLERAGWADLQRHVIGRIAAAIEVYISADRLSRTLPAADGQSSHDAWLRGRAAYLRWTPEAEAEARAIFEGIIARDPTFAPAHASLANLLNVSHINHPGRPRDPALHAMAHRLAARAVELDPMDSRNQSVVAWTAALTGAWDRATIHFDLAVSLNPNCPATLISCAMGQAWLGDPERGEALVADAFAVSPALPDWLWCYAAAVHFFSGRIEAGINAAERSGDHIVDNQGWAAALLATAGRTGEARAAFARLMERVGPVWSGPEPLGEDAVFRWFVGAYPIRRTADRERLAEALSRAMPR
jgi:class 3 adenylate cyclase/DNA-binding SARP family transcriptional activator